MILRVCTFTEQGEILARKTFEGWQEMICQNRSKEIPLGKWTGECFEKHLPILFIGACGIAVRAIAPYVADKLSDSAVLVMDEKGEYVIPLLSGHVGGANELAIKVAERTGATPVLTTATDVEGMFSVDVFARKNGLRIINRDGIRIVSGKLLRGEDVTVTWEDGKENVTGMAVSGALPSGVSCVPFDAEYADVRIVTKEGLTRLEGKTQGLLLVFREYVIGMGCKKGKGFEELKEFLENNAVADWEDNSFAMASIDLKAREEGLWELAQFYHLSFETYSAEELSKIEGEFSGSEFVKSATGVDNVCERAALCLAGEGGELVLRKTAENGMTLAIARRAPKIKF